MHKKPLYQLSVFIFLLGTFFLFACNKSSDSSPAILVKEPTTLTLSETRTGLSAATIGNKLVVAGGYNGGYSTAVDVFTLGTDGKLAKSTENLTLSEARSFSSAAATNNKLIVAGGFSSGAYSTTVDVFTVGTDGKLAKSTENLSLSEGRLYLSAGAIANKLVVAGGKKSTTNYSDKIDVFTVGTDGILTKSTENLTLSEARSNLSTATVGNKLVFAGGFKGNGTYSDKVDVFTITGGNLVKSTENLTLSEARGYLSAATIGNKLVIAGGSRNGGYSNTVDVFTLGTDGKLAKSTENLILSAARGYLSAVTIGNKLVIAGGSNSTNYSNAIDVFTIGSDGKLVKSTENLSLSEARSGLSAAVIGKKLVIAGGEKSSTSYSNVIDIFSLSK